VFVTYCVNKGTTDRVFTYISDWRLIYVFLRIGRAHVDSCRITQEAVFGNIKKRRKWKVEVQVLTRCAEAAPHSPHVVAVMRGDPQTPTYRHQHGWTTGANLGNT